MDNKSPWSVRQVYFGLVCLFTLAIMLLGGIRLIGSLVDVICDPLPHYPTPDESVYRFNDLKRLNPQLEWEEFLKQVESERLRFQQAEKARRLKSVVNSGAMVLIPLPFYLYHWRAFRREKEG
jgi:hypothetical protein